MPDMTPSKTELRRHFSALRDRLSTELRLVAESAIREALFSLPAWKNTPLVCGYATMGSEMDLSPIWARAVSEGKAYALPVTLSDAREGRMVFRRLSDYTPEKLVPARFRVPEPSDNCPTLDLQSFENALILVPGLAFDNSGYRLGYGGGYYDRFLASLSDNHISATTVGLAFSVCHTQALPHAPHDIPVDYIIDERRVICPYGSKS
ncbi:MAG: 5-formyltetrahydrofolate cyclo-ligase [Clostridia bacterium]|nr:5-formyltetrahydrofolate cyclo-ligase [Clostridia bacterium]